MPRTLHVCRPQCQIEVFARFQDGREIVLDRGHNTLTYQGFDALAQVLSGNLDACVNAFFFKFDSSGAASSESPAGQDVTVDEFLSLSDPWDYVRGRLTPGALSSTDSGLYVSNQATLVPIASTGSVGELNELVMSSSSKITKAALVFAPEWSDRTQDLVYAAWAPSVPIAPPSGAAVGLRWNVGFSFPE